MFSNITGKTSKKIRNGRRITILHNYSFNRIMSLILHLLCIINILDGIHLTTFFNLTSSLLFCNKINRYLSEENEVQFFHFLTKIPFRPEEGGKGGSFRKKIRRKVNDLALQTSNNIKKELCKNKVFKNIYELFEVRTELRLT